MKHDLSWGNSLAVRQALVDNQRDLYLVFDESMVYDLNYPAHSGNTDVIELTHQVIKRQTGQAYKHVFLTNGATGAVTIALRAYKHKGCRYVKTREAPYFSIYPQMISASGLTHVDDASEELVHLIDAPSNPLGELTYQVSSVGPIVWDAVYANNVYCNKRVGIPHDVVCGSYSKLTGVNGIRIGWIGTNDDVLALRIAQLVEGEYCGISAADSLILMNLLDGMDWDSFEHDAKAALNYNRTKWQSVEKYFNAKVNENGMFYYSEMDNACRKLMDKAGIVYQTGDKMGHDANFGRFNLGQSQYTILEAVKAIKKADKI